jgi:hypothetical protein
MARRSVYADGMHTTVTLAYVQTATLHCLPVYFTHLWKIRAPLHTVCGFDVSPFDTVIQVRVRAPCF